jgi:hypothetical protein
MRSSFLLGVVLFATACSYSFKEAQDAGPLDANDPPQNQTCSADSECPPTADCVSWRCNKTTSRCESAASIGFDVGTVSIAAPSSLQFDRDPRNCFAELGGYIFACTNNGGVAAYEVPDPAVSAARTVQVLGMPAGVRIARMAATPQKLYMLGEPVVSGTDLRLPLMTVLAPKAGESSLTASLRYFVYPSAGAVEIDTLLPIANGIVVARGASPTSVAIIPDDAITDQSIVFTKLANGPTIRLMAVSDGRAIIRTSLVDFKVSTPLAVAPVTVSGNQSVAASIGDSVINNSPAVTTPNGGFVNISHPGLPMGAGISQFEATSARLGWLLDDGTDATFSGDLQVDLEAYAPPLKPEPNSGVTYLGGTVPSRVVAIDDTHILALAPAHESPLSQISVQVVSRAGATVAVEPKRRALVNYVYDNNKPQRISVAVNKYRGYIFSMAAGSGPVSSVDLRVVAPRCDAP